MGNTISFIGSHGKRLLNRYNAQFRAHKFLDREKLPSAPRHALPDYIREEPVMYEHLQKKDIDLDNYLKNVYIKSHDEEPLRTNEKNPERPLPVYSETPNPDAFQEPVKRIKGLCTIPQFLEFRSAHENDPEENTPAVIAKQYGLDVKKVENLLKYYSVFTVYDVKSPDESDESKTTLEGDFMKEIYYIKEMSKYMKLRSANSPKEKLPDEKLLKEKESQEVKPKETHPSLVSQNVETLKPDREEVKN